MTELLVSLDPSLGIGWEPMLKELVSKSSVVHDHSEASAGMRIAHVGPSEKIETTTNILVEEDVVIAFVGRLRATTRSGSAAACVAAAYRRMGAECGRALQGEFAFVIWDRRDRRLVAGSDPIGHRSLAWARVGEGLVLSSRALALLRHPRVPSRLDEVYLAHSLCDFWAQPGGMTPFAAIRRIRPGFALVARAGSVVESRVDALGPKGPSGGARSAREHVSSFWDCLSEAVEDAVDGTETAAIELSSGLDSTAVAVAALNRRPEVQALSVVAPAAGELDERRLVETFVASRTGIRWHAVDCGGDGALGEPYEDLPIPDDPFVTGAAFLPARLRLTRAARELGVDVLLDGEGGDEIFGMAPGLGDLLADHSWAAAASYMTGRGLRTSFVRELLLPNVPPWVRSAWATRERRLRDPIPEWMSAEFRARAATEEAIRQRDVGWGHWRSPQRLSAILESAPHVGSRQALRLYRTSLGIGGRSPLLDRRLVELALALPPALVIDSVRSKLFLRNALRDHVPSATALQPKNEDLYRWFHRQGLQHRDARSMCLEIEACPVVGPRVRTGALVQLLDGVRAGEDLTITTAEKICAVLQTTRWLRQLRGHGLLLDV